MTLSDQEACALIDSKDLTGYANDLQKKIKYTASVLDGMTVYQPSVAKNSVGVVALNAKSALSMWSNPFAYPFFPMISDDEIMRLAKMTGATVEEIKQIVVGYIPQNVSNETVICVMSYLAEKNTISNKTIKKHSKENLNQIAKVYSCGNYIENQMFWEDVKYGNKDMAYSGCEIIAVVNALHSMGKDLNNEEVAALISKFEADGAMLNGTWGTCPNKLADYLVEDAGYNVKCTSSTDYNEIEEVGKNSDTIIVTLYNDDNDILAQIHTINIEKQTDANGNVVYIGHNTAYYDDINGDNDGVPDNNEMIPSKKYSSLEDAIKDASHGNNSAPIMVMGISAPCQGDFPESETKAC
ncbi:hypothetical protein [Butyrivibrio sp. AE2005]|uniref:hypothetical protein n=1 Tax=Butyrivibrio sp. AE2005 TaxID=1496722 RepID=UPI00047E1EF1|nr:hypothetical protein [Butyrivibrio sp. AE2005]